MLHFPLSPSHSDAHPRDGQSSTLSIGPHCRSSVMFLVWVPFVRRVLAGRVGSVPRRRRLAATAVALQHGPNEAEAGGYANNPVRRLSRHNENELLF